MRADSLDWRVYVGIGRAWGTHCAAVLEYRARLPGRRSIEVAMVVGKVSPDGRWWETPWLVREHLGRLVQQ